MGEDVQNQEERDTEQQGIDTPDTEADVRVGYQVAVNLLNHEEQQMWVRSRVMLVANGIIVAVIGWSLSQHLGGLRPTWLSWTWMMPLPLPLGWP